jgi:ATP-dependent Clp protease adaptor protein ClpS
MSDFEYTEDVSTKDQVTEPPRFKVLLLNDDYTTFEFVKYILKSIFKKSDLDAEAITMHVHKNGYGICGMYSKEVAETKIMQVHQKSESAGYPLQCIMEEA